MTSRLIEDAEMEKALDFLRDNAKAIGEARAAMIKTDRMVKHILAIETLRAEGAAAIREAHARASKVYLDAVTAEAVAAGRFEEMRALREAAAAKIECWRSEQATLRGMRV